jgi:hypothetical protein
VLFNQIEVDESFSTGKDTHPVVVDDERRFLLPDKSEDNGIPMNDSQFIIDKEVLSYLSQMRFEDCPHP